MKKRIVIAVMIILGALESGCRTIYRPIDPLMPEITVRWQGDKNGYTLKKYHLEYPLFELFDPQDFNKHLLPQTPIASRYDENLLIEPTILQNLIENLLQEIKIGKRSFTDFTVLQSKDYNFKKGRGLLIVKFKEYPFVVKLFVETPDSFVSPFDKGMEPIFFFFMGGGVNRHLTGFTRIKIEKSSSSASRNLPGRAKLIYPVNGTGYPQARAGSKLKGKISVIKSFSG